VFVYLTIIGVDILRFYFLLSYLVLDSIEKIYQIFKSVWTHFQTPSSSSKILRCASYFQLSSRCLDMWLNTVFCVWYIRSINFFFVRLSSYITLSVAQVFYWVDKKKIIYPLSIQSVKQSPHLANLRLNLIELPILIFQSKTRKSTHKYSEPFKPKWRMTICIIAKQPTRRMSSLQLVLIPPTVKLVQRTLA